MRFATLNTWGTRGRWDARLAVLRDGFGLLDADIIVLQETILTDDFDQAAEMLGPGYHLAQQAARHIGHGSLLLYSTLSSNTCGPAPQASGPRITNQSHLGPAGNPGGT